MPGSSLWLVPPPTHPLTPILTTLIKDTLPTHFPLESSSTSSSSTTTSSAASRAPPPPAGGGHGAVAPHFFAPHVTLTSGIPPERYGADPGGWLEREVLAAWRARKERRSASGKTGGDGEGEEGEGEGEGVSTEEGGGGGVRIRFERVESQDVFFRRCFVRVRFEEEGVRELAGLARAKGVIGEGVEVDEEGEGGLKFGKETEKWLEEWRREFGPHLSLMYGDVPIRDKTMSKITELVQEAGVKLTGEQSERGGLDGWEGGVVWLVPTDKPISEWKPIATRELP